MRVSIPMTHSTPPQLNPILTGLKGSCTGYLPFWIIWPNCGSFLCPMPHILKNEYLELHIDAPLENYSFSRFDWTGKIVQVTFRGIPLSVIETIDGQGGNAVGRGFCNEFGIDEALGFEEAEIGGWFHKIGVGLLKKDSDHYLFSKAYKIEPAEFACRVEEHKVLMSCLSKTVNGYAYALKKEIELHESGFTIKYMLHNTGNKNLKTTEYNHNFIGINGDLIGSNYLLKLPFPLRTERLGEVVNPEQKVDLGGGHIKFKDPIKEQFFFSNLPGGRMVDAAWELVHSASKIVISETASFKTDRINLWGWQQVVSPELFHSIDLQPNESTEWSRKYTVLEIN